MPSAEFREVQEGVLGLEYETGTFVDHGSSPPRHPSSLLTVAQLYEGN